MLKRICAGFFLLGCATAWAAPLSLSQTPLFVTANTTTAAGAASLIHRSRLYIPILDATDWSGMLIAYPVNTDGTLDMTGSGPFGSEWEAGSLLTALHWDTARQIISYRKDTATGIAFRWANLSAAQQTALNIDPVTRLADALGSQRLDYIRGDSSNEPTFRTRTTHLGDLAHTAPAGLSASPYHYEHVSWPAGAPENSAVETYATFKSAWASRTPIIYQGSNNGLLHMIHATTGIEQMAYVPSKVIDNLFELTNPSYTHMAFVDGQIALGDAYFSSDQHWHSTLVSGLGLGGQSLFALDVTDPSLYTSEGNASSITLWEFDDTDDADLGYVYGEPVIARMADGNWAAIFGNGYNNTESDGYASTTGNAVLYIVDIEDGSLIRKIDTGVGMSSDPLATSRPNGLAPPAVVDTNGDHIADTIYAGDLFGNLWKFDVSSTTSASWGLASNGAPLFVAEDSGGTAQPITSKPVVIRREGIFSEFIVLFGTGKYLETSDATPGSDVQSLYGIFDDGSNTVARSDLLPQSILSEVNTTSPAETVRISTSNTLSPGERGWYMDLIVLGESATGEMMVKTPFIRGPKALFTTLIPSTAPEDLGGTSWVMMLNAQNGAYFTMPGFDISGDGLFDVNDYADYLSSPTPVSGLKSKNGILQSPTIASAGNSERFYHGSTTGGGSTYLTNPMGGGWGRQAWQEYGTVLH